MTMKFRAHETFFIRKGWLSKGMKYVTQRPDVFVSKDENPMDILGIGSNMVKSLRYWMQTVGLTHEPIARQRVQYLTELGQRVYERDRFVEETGTLQLIHYMLSKNKENATAWYFFFNEYTASEFTKEDFVVAMQNYVLMQEESSTVALRSIGDDFSCIVNTYLSKIRTTSLNVSPESNISCPLEELGLIDIVSKEKKTYKKTIPYAEKFNPWIVLAIIVDQANGRDELGLNELLTAPCNIGKTFNLDAITMLNILHQIERLGGIKIIRTAGLDVVKILQHRTFLDCVDNYYQNIEDN